jgi:hypothetical protein
MPGKYSSLKGQLTKLSLEPEYQEKVNAEKKRIREFLTLGAYPINVTQFSRIYIKARQEKAKLEELVKGKNLTIEAMSQELVEMLENEGYSNVKVENGASISIKDDVYCSVSDKEAFYSWIKEQGLDDLFTVNYQTMSSMVKNKLIDMEPIPPGIGTYFKQSITLRGGKFVE